jgi:hypothetical protein
VSQVKRAMLSSWNEFRSEPNMHASPDASS